MNPEMDRFTDMMKSRREHAQAVQKTHNDRVMLRITFASTAVAVMAAIGALWSGYEAHQTRIEDERPFVAVDASPYIPRAMNFANEQMNPGDIMPLQTLVTAFGKSPSKHIHVVCATVADNPGIEWKPTKDYGEWNFVYLLPSRSGEIACPYVGPPIIQPKHEGITYIQFGVAEYQDVSGSTFRTPFCQEILPGTPMIHIEQCSDSFALPELK
jgi:hypothetical protein